MGERADVRVGADGVARCGWVGDDAEYIRYHDEEWGRPLHDERRLFEKLCLEGFQAGLSWITILRKRPRFRQVFADFDPVTVAGFGEDDILRLLGDAGIIRHRGKIEAAICNASLVAAMSPGEFDALMWSYPPVERRRRASSMSDLPAATAESTALSKELRRRGFRFVGPTTMYALMQSAGMVDDHLVGCHRAS